MFLSMLDQAQRYARQILWFEDQGMKEEAKKIRKAWQIFVSQFTGDNLSAVKEEFFMVYCR